MKTKIFTAILITFFSNMSHALDISNAIKSVKQSVVQISQPASQTSNIPTDAPQNASQPVVSNQQGNDVSKYVGEYTLKVQGMTGGMTVQATPIGKLHISINATNANASGVCDAAGDVTLVGGKAILSDPDDPDGKVKLVFSDNIIMAVQEGGGWCGLNADMSGKYVKEAIDKTKSAEKTENKSESSNTQKNNTPITQNEIKDIDKNYAKNVKFPLKFESRLYSSTGVSHGKQGDFAAWFEAKTGTVWCESISGNLLTGKKQTVSGVLKKPVYSDDEGGKAFYMKDCVVK